MAEFLYPETWTVGDDLNAETLNRRVRDQNSILLRRPLLVAHSSVDQTIPTTADTTISFDTIDNDDDGMAVTGTPATKFYAQRDGTYQIWYNLTFVGNGVAGNLCQTSLWINGVTAGRRWDCQTTMIPTNGKLFCHAINGTVSMAAGEYLVADAYQTTGGTVTIQASNNTPRIAIMWLGIT